MTAARKISLRQQLEEVDYELRQRDQVYERLAQQSPQRRSELDYHVERMRAVRATLAWLHKHEALARACAEGADLQQLLTAVYHGLKSYEHGNAAPALAGGLAADLAPLIEATEGA